MSVEEAVWQAEEHTFAKHKILKGYLDAWAPIMARQAAKSFGRSPLYIDAFAGPGVYKDGADGSPVVAMKAVLNHSQSMPSPIRMSFFELDARRHEILNEKISALRDRDRSRLIVEQVSNTTCEVGLRALIGEEKGKYGTLGPALVFLDQFGYSQAPMELIGEVMSGVSCEAFIYLDYRRMSHTLGDPDKAPALTRAFGSRVWEAAVGLEGNERVKSLRDSYKQALNDAGAEYVWDFEMRGKNNELLSWLFFCTSSERGLEEMKKAMFKLDVTGNFRFSDRYVNQLNLLAEVFDQSWLAGHLHNHFEEEPVRYREIRKHVLTETPLIRFKEALAKLEREDKLRVISPPEGRRRFSFNFDDSVLIEFVPAPGKQARLF